MLMDEEPDDLSDATSSSVEETWISWFCGLSGNELFCEVDTAFITDNFNMFGIRNYIPSEEYSHAMNIVLDRGGCILSTFVYTYSAESI